MKDNFSTSLLGLHKILDLGEWWHEEQVCRCRWAEMLFGAISAPDRIKEVSQLLRESIRYSLDNREDALEYAMQFARDMDPELADRFVAMWVNDLTLDYTERGREAVRLLLDEGFKKQIIPHPVKVEFVDG